MGGSQHFWRFRVVDDMRSATTDRGWGWSRQRAEADVRAKWEKQGVRVVRVMMVAGPICHHPPTKGKGGVRHDQAMERERVAGLDTDTNELVIGIQSDGERTWGAALDETTGKVAMPPPPKRDVDD